MKIGTFYAYYRKYSITAAWDTKSLGLNNFEIKMNFKKTLKDRLRNSQQNGVFTFLKLIFNFFGILKV